MARAYTTEILTELGYHVLEASSAAAGLEFLDRMPISTRADLPAGRSFPKLRESRNLDDYESTPVQKLVAPVRSALRSLA